MKNFKNLIVYILIIVFCLSFSACGQKTPENNPDNNSGAITYPPTMDDPKDESYGVNGQFFKTLYGLTHEKESQTEFTLTINNGEQKTLYYKISIGDQVEVDILDGESKSFSGKTVEEVTNMYNDLVLNGELAGNLQDFAFLPPSKLFNFNNETVKFVNINTYSNNTTTFIPYIYEGKVLLALTLFKNQFKNVKDVLNLSFRLETMGSKSEINLFMSCVLEDNTTITYDLDLIHTKTIKVIE